MINDSRTTTAYASCRGNKFEAKNVTKFLVFSYIIWDNIRNWTPAFLKNILVPLIPGGNKMVAHT